MTTNEPRSLTVDDIIDVAAALPGVVATTAGEDNGAPRQAWGDTFLFFDPDGTTPADRRFPFATVVVHDYDGFDTASHLYRTGVFRLNVAVGRDEFRDLLGYPPAGHARHGAAVDYTALDLLLPHRVYAPQGWVSILNPGVRTAAQVPGLLAVAHARAARRHRP